LYLLCVFLKILNQTKEGKEGNKEPKHTKDWNVLKVEAAESKGNNLPQSLKGNYEFPPPFFMVFSYRGNPDVLRWLDEKIRNFR